MNDGITNTAIMAFVAGVIVGVALLLRVLAALRRGGVDG